MSRSMDATRRARYAERYSSHARRGRRLLHAWRARTETETDRGRAASARYHRVARNAKEAPVHTGRFHDCRARDRAHRRQCEAVRALPRKFRAVGKVGKALGIRMREDR